MSAGTVMILVEDNPADVFLIEEALRLHELPLKMVVLGDAETAIRWVESNAPKESPPAVVVLDLNLPKRSGADVLDVIRSQEHLRNTPVIIFTSSSSQRDRALQYRYPNTSYLRKSADFDEFMRIGELLKEAIGAQRS